MRYLILSDLHANWQGLQAVLDDSKGQYDRVLCCGDLVGYGADPNPIVDWVREHCELVVRGNHDRACTGQDDLEWFNPVARQAALWTMENLTPENARFTRDLPKGPLMVEAFELVHGSPFDEDEYMLAADEAGQAFNYLERRLSFFGHTHVQGGFIWNHSRVETIPRPSPRAGRQLVEIDPDCAYMINPGSTGQPRDGDPRAAYVLFDPDAQVVTYCRVEYDIGGAQKQIRDAGLPAILADRLVLGR
ncbi:MAG TPA: metallophosphoesterase family protein [Candidatus Sulfopaludibacter sp.]|nr:metallophosphoesterase family protein [Candidatus Sulfopaludibacter sp.]